MTVPKRIQQRRAKGWIKPDGAVSVARPHRFGNPIRIIDKRVVLNGVDLFVGNPHTTPTELAAFTVRAYRWQLLNHPNVIGYSPDDVRAELRGKDLMCFCKLDKPCHVDVLLEVANA